MAENRLDRELETREITTRKKAWQRPETLPSPNPEPGYTYRWIRTSTHGQVDATNVSSKLREGWEPVKAVDHPEITLVTIENEKFKFITNSDTPFISVIKSPQDKRIQILEIIKYNKYNKED